MRAIMLPAFTNVELLGLYSSSTGVYSPNELPPETSTAPFNKLVVFCPYRPVDKLPVGEKVPVFGSYNSALVCQGATSSFDPPATRTFPEGSNAAVNLFPRGVLIDPVGANVPDAGSYSSADDRNTFPYDCPPATSTLPLRSSVAVWLTLAWARLPVSANTPVVGS